MKRILLILLFAPALLIAQTTKKVCFIGNSYIYTNDMPTMIGNMAIADGNTLIKDQNTIGGYTLASHSTNSTSLNKIAANTWDFVVFQDQSQLPSFPWSQVQTEVIPFAKILCDSVRSANACAIPLFFDTWGRQVGDPQWDSIDTFTEMNQRLYYAYEFLADDNSGQLAPVGIAFEHIANDGLGAVTFNQLYSGDGSHPSIFGTYLTSCIFYEQIYNTSSVGNTYLPSGISNSQSTYLQNVAHYVLTAVDTIVTDFTQPIAEFSNLISTNSVSFNNESQHDFSWLWNFGDGNSSDLENPSHTYSSSGTYSVELIAYYCEKSDTIEYDVMISELSIDAATENNKIVVYPNPSLDGFITISGAAINEMTSIFSLDGRLIASIKINTLNSSLFLEPGTYIILSGASRSIVVVL